MTTQTLIHKIETIEKIEKQLFELKKGGWFNFAKAPISLKGTMKNIKISQKDIKVAKKSLFKI